MHDQRPVTNVDKGTLRINLFAGMADVSGCRSVEIEWTGGTVGDLRSRLAACIPAIETLLSRSAVAIAATPSPLPVSPKPSVVVAETETAAPDKAADIACCRVGWELALKHFADPEVDFVLLDELNVVLQLEYLPIDEVLVALRAKRADQHVVVTGRGARPEFIELADLVTEMRMIKHPFSAGVQAQAGIEF